MKYNYLEKFKNTHGDKYDYSRVNYINSHIKVKIICPIHGEFEKSPSKHINGQGCPKCSYENRILQKTLTNSDFIDKAIKIHGNKYNYSKVNYKSSHTKICIICSDHGEFYQTPNSHLNGTGCPNCGKIKTLQKQYGHYTTEYFVNRAKNTHGNKYDYSLVNYIGCKIPIKIVCPIHGTFTQLPMVHLKGCHCPKCAFDNSSKNRIIVNGNNIIQKFEHIHGNKYDYSKVNYTHSRKHVKIICPIHGEFEQVPNNHLMGKGCPKCGNIYSSQQEFIKNYLIKNNIKFIENDRDILNGLELDFYLPDYKISIECNGIYWHSELNGKDKNYHLNKTILCKNKGVQLLHINENEFKNTPNIIKSKLNSILKINKRKLYARKCQIKEIDVKLKNKFLDKYHLQGSDKSSIKLGLFYHNKLISVMTFCKRRIALGKKTSQDGEYELSRYCGNFHFYVIGGASKLLKYFEQHYNPTKIITYADKRWSMGNLYYNLNFVYNHTSNPNYWYFKDGYSNKLYHRFNFRKSNLYKKLDKFDSNLTEWENMQMNNYDRIWDCGNMVFTKVY